MVNDSSELATNSMEKKGTSQSGVSPRPIQRSLTIGYGRRLVDGQKVALPSASAASMCRGSIGPCASPMLSFHDGGDGGGDDGGSAAGDGSFKGSAPTAGAAAATADAGAAARSTAPHLAAAVLEGVGS